MVATVSAATVLFVPDPLEFQGGDGGRIGGLIGPCAIIRSDLDFYDADDWPFRELGAVRGVRCGVPGVCAGDADADWGVDRVDCRSCNLLCEVLAVRGVRRKSV